MKRIPTSVRFLGTVAGSRSLKLLVSDFHPRPKVQTVRFGHGAHPPVTVLLHGAFLCLLLSADAGCGTEHAPPVQGQTDTDGVVTTGVEGGSVDDTAANAPYYCIYNDENPTGLTGVKHQCGLEYDLDITFTVSPPIGSDFQVPLSVSGVQTVSEDSTYEHPYVIACCTDVTDHPDWPFTDSCDYEHHRACLSDFIEHICDAPGVWLERAALDFTGQGREAIESAAEWFSNNRSACHEHFWSGPDSLHTADLCSTDFDGFFDHTPWEPGVSFAYVVGETVIAEASNFVIAPRSSLDEDVPMAPPTPAESCALPDSNNGETPPSDRYRRRRRVQRAGNQRHAHQALHRKRWRGCLSDTRGIVSREPSLHHWL